MNPYLQFGILKMEFPQLPILKKMNKYGHFNIINANTQFRWTFIKIERIEGIKYKNIFGFIWISKIESSTKAEIMKLLTICD